MALAKGQIDTQAKAVGSVQLSASSVWAKASGYFFAFDGTNGTADQSAEGDSFISGWVDIGFDPDDSNVSSGVLTVPSTTTDKYRFPYFSAGLDAVYTLPIKSGTTLTKGHAGFLCDLETTASGIQTVDIDSAGEGLLQILLPTDEEITAGQVRVVINPKNVGR